MRLCSLGFRRERRPRRLLPDDSSHYIHLSRISDSVTHSSRKPGYLWSSSQTLVSPTRYWCSRDAGSKDWALKESSTQISNERSECSRVRFHTRSMCETSRVTPMMLTQVAWRSWDINQGKLVKMMWAPAIQAIGQEFSKPLGTPIMLPLDLHTRHNAAEFNACSLRPYLALLQPSLVLLLDFSLEIKYLLCDTVYWKNMVFPFSFFSYFWIKRHSWEFFLKAMLDLNFSSL